MKRREFLRAAAAAAAGAMSRPSLARRSAFGETTAAKTISDDLGDRQRSVYSIDAARERRVEIVEVKRN